MSGLLHQFARTPSEIGRYSHVFIDLFGTLIHPTLPVHVQYDRIAKLNGFVGLNLEQKHFKSAFKKVNKEFPNYGKQSWITSNCSQMPVRMSPKDWWLKVINETFLDSMDSHLAQGQSFESEKVEKLSLLVYNAFLRNEEEQTYTTYPDTLAFINHLTKRNIKFSLVTNSDPEVLNAMPWKLKKLLSSEANDYLDIPVFTSWDVGYSKPNKRIWDFAISRLELDISRDRLLHIGDDFEEDFLGAKSAGLESIWLDRKDNHQKISKPIANKVDHYEFKPEERVHSLTELFDRL